MTYCCGILVRDGLVMVADTRTNAGVDNISTFRKLHVYTNPGERIMALASSGNLSLSQSVRSTLVEGIENPETGEFETLMNAPTMFQAAQRIGRAVTGVYNKVMNFRSIDPRDARAGLAASGAIDDRVWNEFFDPAANLLREADLEQEFNRLWMSTAGNSEPALDAEATQERAEAAARRLEGQELDDLLARYHASLAVRPARPRASSSTTRVYERDPLVIAIARKRAGHRCEVAGCDHPQFVAVDGLPYCEVHHVIPLAEGGEDRIENAACLCPSHHREVHHGNQRSVEGGLGAAGGSGVADDPGGGGP
jgi:ribosomal protein L12E/L44/L45/RPP1/RPP2